MSLQTFFDNFGLLADAPNGAQKLRELILQLAVRGQLDTQNLNDEPASGLLGKVQLEKGTLNGKKISKVKLPLISDDARTPFDLPRGWVWARLGDSLLKLTDGTHNSPPNFPHGDFKYISAKNIKQGRIELSNVTYVSAEVHNEIYSRCNPEMGDILYIKDGATTGVVAINSLTEPFSMLSSVALLKVPSVISKEYLFYVLSSPYFYSLMREGMTGVAITRVTLSKLNSALIPIAPHEEQKRIVVKVDELMRLCDALEVRQQARRESRVRLNNATLAPLNNAASLAPDGFEQASARLADNFDALYDSAETVSKLRATILQLAVQGKLAPQNEEDEPASALLGKHYSLPEENQRLKKRIKDSPVALSDEMFPPLPSTWSYALIQNLYDKNIIIDYADGNHGELYPRKSDFGDDGVIFVTAAQIANGKVQWEKCSKLAESKASKLNKGWARGGDVLLTHNATVGRVAIVENEIAPFLLGTSVTFYRLNKQALDKEFFYICLISPVWQSQLSAIMQQTTRNQVSIQKQAFFLIPVPPLREQKRIIAKVNQLMVLCDELEAKLLQAETDSKKLMSAAVRQVLASISQTSHNEPLSVVA